MAWDDEDLLRLRELLVTECGGKQHALAARLQVSTSSVSRWLRCQTRPRGRMLAMVTAELREATHRATARGVAADLGPAAEMEVDIDDDER
jgi:DNA-binding transcriptional regulator YiaG